MASPKKGYPNRNEGLNGDLSINITPNGLGLFGKVKDKWYRFGSAQEESRRGNVNTSQNSLKSDYVSGLNLLGVSAQNVKREPGQQKQQKQMQDLFRQMLERQK